MNDKDTGGPAFPCHDICMDDFPGMTLRDNFAGKALQGWIAEPCSGDIMDSYADDSAAFTAHQEAVAEACYGYADAMLKERAK